MATGSQKRDIATMLTPYSERAALGLETGVATWNKFGYNEGVGTTAEVIAEFGAAFNQKLIPSETLSIVSDNVADDAAGTGLRTAIVFGVDANWALVTEVVTMDGTTPVTTTNSFIGVNRLTIFQSGSADSNVGTITATASSSGNVMATMPAGQGTTQQLIFYVPEDYQFLATWLLLNAIKSSGGGNPEVTFYGYVYSAVVDSTFEIFRATMDTQIEELVQLTPAEPFVVGEKSILWFEAVSSAASTSVRGRFSGKLVAD